MADGWETVQSAPARVSRAARVPTPRGPRLGPSLSSRSLRPELEDVETPPARWRVQAGQLLGLGHAVGFAPRAAPAAAPGSDAAAGAAAPGAADAPAGAPPAGGAAKRA